MTDASTTRVRAGDTDRDDVIAQLRTHHEAGRLTAEEFEERMAAALAARWLDELPPLLADLPAPERERRAGRDGERERPPWARPGGGQPARVARRPRFPVLPILAVVAAVLLIGAVAHGHFPWLLLWIGLAALWFRGTPWRMRRWGGYR